MDEASTLPNGPAINSTVEDPIKMRGLRFQNIEVTSVDTAFICL